MESAQEVSVDRETAQIICVVGGPGVGKGTQCTKLAAELGLVHISVGDLLRAAARTSPVQSGVQIESAMRNGSLVPYHQVRDILDRFLIQQMQNGRPYFLIDGFPRSKEQAQFFEELGWKAKAVLHFYCPEDVMVSRVLKRAETSGRIDDSIEVFRKRYAGHMQEISGVLEAFSGKVIDIDCQNPLDEIYEELKRRVEIIFGIGQ